MITLDLNTILLISGVIGAICAPVIWAIRMEGKQKESNINAANDRARIEKLENKVEAMDSELLKRLGHIEQSLAQIHGYLRAKREALDEPIT